MKMTMQMMDAAKSYLDHSGPLYKKEKPASVWLSMETSKANPNAGWLAHCVMCQEVINKVATLI